MSVDTGVSCFKLLIFAMTLFILLYILLLAFTLGKGNILKSYLLYSHSIGVALEYRIWSNPTLVMTLVRL